MSARDIFEYVLVEMNKVNAPNIILEDFNYFLNKAINQYVNKRYNIYDISQQTTDDLRVLKATALLTPSTLSDADKVSYQNMSVLNATYKVQLPDDYLHMLNCICNFLVIKPWRCYDTGNYVQFPAEKLTADLWGLVVNNYWIKPTYRRPYYYIHNGTLGYNQNPTNNSYSTGLNSNSVNNTVDSIKVGGTRYGNKSNVICEIRYGTDSETFKLESVYIDYIKAPQFIRLTQSLIDKVQDTSLILEFPDYVCQEIINELVHIIMENISDLRLQTHPVVSLSIVNPAQQLTQEPLAQLGQN